MTQATKNLNETYRFSRDYTAILQLLKQGHQIMATVGGNDHQQGSIARAVYCEGEGRIMIDANDQTVFAFPPEDLFIRRCEKMNIQFILPTANMDFPVLPPTCWIEPTPENLAKHGNQAIISFDLSNGPDVSAEVTYFTSPQTDKLHFHPTDEDQNEKEDSNLRRFRSIENPPQTPRDFCKPRPEMIQKFIELSAFERNEHGAVVYRSYNGNDTIEMSGILDSFLDMVESYPDIPENLNNDTEFE